MQHAARTVCYLVKQLVVPINNAWPCAGVPDSPLDNPDLSSSSSDSYAATAAAVLLMMKTGQDLCIPQACATGSCNHTQLY